MTHPDIKFLKAISVFIGSVVGVGVFGLPYAFSKSGFALGLVELLIIIFALSMMQLMFAEVAIRTEGHYRLTGYIEKYLKGYWKLFALISIAILVWGAMLAYLIVGGEFLQNLLAPIVHLPTTCLALALTVVVGILVYRGMRFAAGFEIVVMSALFLFYFVIIFCALPHIDFQNLTTIHLTSAFFPYGVILFSMAGLSVVPEMKEILGSHAKKQLAHAILIGLSIISVLYICFTIAVLGATGIFTTQAAFDGLIPILGNGFRFVVSALGSLTVTSIFMILGIELMNMLRFDFGLNKKLAWFVVMIVPILFYLFGFREFTSILGFIGSIFCGLVGIMICKMYLKTEKQMENKTHTCLNVHPIFVWAVICIFSFGIILKIITLFT